MKKNTIKTEPKPELILAQMEVIENLNKTVKSITQSFEVEMNCKNQAYYFIIQNGHYEEYVKYTKENPVKK